MTKLKLLTSLLLSLLSVYVFATPTQPGGLLDIAFSFRGPVHGNETPLERKGITTITIDPTALPLIIAREKSSSGDTRFKLTLKSVNQIQDGLYLGFKAEAVEKGKVLFYSQPSQIARYDEEALLTEKSEDGASLELKIKVREKKATLENKPSSPQSSGGVKE